MARPVVALLTDFGTRDPFVGVMKGVVLGRCPDAAIVDLTHEIPAQAVAEGAFWLERSFEWLPMGTVVVAVVDPGVGSVRRALAAEAHGRMFVGPDNGLLAPAIERDPGARVRVLDAVALGLPSPSRTFHGRDVFAKVAADLASGALAAERLGPVVRDWVRAAVAAPVVHGTSVEGVVVTVDRFGNLITNLDARLIGMGPVRVVAESLELPLSLTYSDVGPGEPVALVNSFGVVEIALRDGDAAAALGLRRGASVTIRGAD